MANVSVVIVNWNGKRFLKECLDSVFSQTYKDFEVVFVDNGSADGSVEFVRQAYPKEKVKIVENKENLGFAGANNIGIRESGGSYVLTLNNDTKADARLLEELVECAARHGESVGAVAAKILYYSEPSRINSAGIVALKDGAGRDRAVKERDSPRWNEEEEVFGPCAGAALYRKSALLDCAVEGEPFDSSFFAYFEDVDLAYRLRLRGWRTIYCPKAAVLHHGRGTSSKIPEFNVYYGQANRLKIIIKDMPFSLIARFLPWILARQALEFAYFTLFKLSFAPISARARVFSELGALLRKRRATQAGRRISESEFAAPFRGSPFSTIFRERVAGGAD